METPGTGTPRKPRPARASAQWKAARPVVFTALEGTLLDFETFEAGASRAALKRLANEDVPIVPVSVMTMSELEPIARDLGFKHAMIIEAGGAIARRTPTGWNVEPCGPESDVLLDAVAAIENRSGADLIVYSVLPEQEAARLSGRSGAMLSRSTQRGFSEPFVVEKGDIADVEKAASELGFKVRRGRRFFYLCRADVEGEAFLRLREELHCDLAIAVGGSPLDAEFLLRSEIPVIVPGADGEVDPELRTRVPRARVAPTSGPAGWAAAVEEIQASIARPGRVRALHD